METEAPPLPPAPRSAPTPSRTRLGFAGLIGAGAALAFGELISGLTTKVPSLVLAVGELVVDKTPGQAVESGIQAAGTNDKPILLFGIVILSLAIGWATGRALIRRGAWIVLAVFGVFAVVGGWAAARNPFSSAGWSWVVAILSGLVGVGVTIVLARAAVVQAPIPDEESAPLFAPTDRRRFFVFAGGSAVVVTGIGLLGRSLRDRYSVEGARQAITLPAAVTAPGTTIATAADGTLDALAGLSPYVTPNKAFYRIDNALTVPQVDPKNWKLTINGMVDTPFSITYDELLAMDLVELPVTLSCVSNEVGGTLVGNAMWRGVPLSTLLDRAGVRAGGAQVLARSVDDFTAGFPIEAVHDGRHALLAIGMNGEPLPVAHGFPARLVVAGLYGYVSAVKWIEKISITSMDEDGYWIPRGWSKLGPIKTQSRIDVPRASARIMAGTTAVAGVAWAPTRGIAKVEVQIDDGEWQPCRLGRPLSNETWVQWVYEWAAQPGRRTIRVRATDGTGALQSIKNTNPAPNGAEGLHTIKVTVV
jgi:DMSO/TMAO reductase YedYZ molybdopterin-dependent catalytic subunit